MTKKIDVRKEYERRKSQSQRILELLKERPFVFTYDLEKIAYNYTMRVSELRKEGHVVVASYERPGVYKYVYKGQKDID